MLKLAVTNRIGLFKCDRRKVHPITFQVLPFQTFSIGSLPDGQMRLNQRIEEIFHLACQLKVIHLNWNLASKHAFTIRKVTSSQQSAVCIFQHQKGFFVLHYKSTAAAAWVWDVLLWLTGCVTYEHNRPDRGHNEELACAQHQSEVQLVVCRLLWGTVVCFTI